MAISLALTDSDVLDALHYRIAISRHGKLLIYVELNARNADLDYMVYMIRYDSTFGRFQGELGTYEHGLIINGQKIPVFTGR